MSINMSNVKKIQIPFPATIYKKTFSFTNSNVVYRGTSTPCPIDVTLYSTTTPAWTGATDTSTSDIWDYIHTTLGYETSGTSTPLRIYLIVDNPYEFEYINNNQSCVLASCQLRNSASIGGSYLLPWFSVPGAGSVQVGSAYTITEKTGWVLAGTFNEYDFYLKVYTVTTSGSYLYFSVSKDILTGEEYIPNYCVNGVSYPNVTISSVSGDTYTLSDGHSYTTTTYNFKTFGGLKEVKKIENLNGDVLWHKPSEGSLKTINAYYIRVYYYNEYYLRKEQLTTKVACATTEANGTKFFLLTLNEFNAIKNGTYSGATAGHTIDEWVNKTYELYWCYFNDNYEIYLVGDSRNSTANDTVLGTTNDSTYAKRYYCFYNSTGYYYVNLVDNSSTSTDVKRWRVTSSTYWVNHTNKVSITDKNTFSFSSTTIHVQPFYIKNGNYYLNRSSTLFVTTSTTASTEWYLDTDNRIYCLDGTEKYYLQCKTWGDYNVYVGTVLSTENDWLYKNGNYITGTISGTTYYLYRYTSGYDGVRMRTTATTLTFVPSS